MFLRTGASSSNPGGINLKILQRPHQDPLIKQPYYAVSGTEINEPAKRVESLASHDVVKPDLIDALIEGLDLLGLDELTSDLDWLLANTLLGGAGDDIERRSTDLVPAASVPSAERDADGRRRCERGGITLSRCQQPRRRRSEQANVVVTATPRGCGVRQWVRESR